MKKANNLPAEDLNLISHRSEYGSADAMLGISPSKFFKQSLLKVQLLAQSQ